MKKVDLRSKALISIEGNVALWLWVPHMESGLSLQATSCGLHQGIFSQPGRVVTLVGSENPEAQVWGAAYEILPQQEAEVTKKLNIREQRFDTRLEMTMYDAEDQKLPHPVMVFVGTSQKELFLGDAPLETLAKQISECHGPSGPNYEYLFQLAKFMRMEVPEAKDEHLFQLEKAVKNILLNINVKFVSSS
ncbi:putative glutathione-specific gamma-glutamylcyclotransferase 2 isoform X3 [Portunus trituberculatus]|uniref:putative glutathione-specific gamma-glutamylcyclotransferase 2 isoform X3 n=1 Tax=Portunus trituberculatus TaxID=210409 RepID=UPI001E1CD31D|nr:putative glutathione-specific gamma-glutamylcyclotransferase 2 isoform X3 [Portunus trituberculatus]